MKTRCWLVAAILCSLVPFYGISQCGTIHTISHSVTINGIGSNEEPHLFSFPRFDGDLGTLTDVTITSEVTLQYNYDFENNEAVPKTPRIKIARYDDIYSPALLNPLSYSHIFPNSVIIPQNATNFYSHPLTGTDGIAGSGTDFADSSLLLLNNSTVINASVATANFIGAGSVPFEYYTTATPTELRNVTGTYFNSSATDQMVISITYTYCDNIVLNAAERDRLTRPTGILVFNHKLYPNPSTNGNFTVQFHNTIRSDWQIETFSSTGQLISQKKFRNTLRADIKNNQLPKGIYIIKATNLKSREIFSDRLLVK